jgi:hypothetical protein
MAPSQKDLAHDPGIGTDLVGIVGTIDVHPFRTLQAYQISERLLILCRRILPMSAGWIQNRIVQTFDIRRLNGGFAPHGAARQPLPV